MFCQPNVYGVCIDTDTIDIRLTKQETERLLTAVNKPYTTDTNDILLAALGLALHKWTGNDRFKISLEGHGREAHLEDIDISRTVGWFTSIYPVLLDASLPESADDHERFGFPHAADVFQHPVANALIRNTAQHVFCPLDVVAETLMIICGLRKACIE